MRPKARNLKRDPNIGTFIQKLVYAPMEQNNDLHKIWNEQHDWFGLAGVEHACVGYDIAYLAVWVSCKQMQKSVESKAIWYWVARYATKAK